LVPILPPAVLLTVLLDGRAMRAYLPVYIANGHVLGPLDPFVVRLARRVGYQGGWLVLSSGGKVVRVRLKQREPAELSRSYVALGPLLRALGAQVTLDRLHRVLLVTSPRSTPIGAPMPFDPAAPQVAPRVVFTPAPVVTPRPVWTGAPRPRRTPLPLSAWGRAPGG
jgi:hypothetical protein